MQTFRLFGLRFRRAYDSTYDSDFLFSQGHKRSYDSDSDSVASEKCFHKKPSPRCILFRVGVVILDPCLESPDNFSGPKSSFMFVVFMHSSLTILKTIQWKYQLTKWKSIGLWTTKCATLQQVLNPKFALGPEKIPGRSRNRPQWTVLTNNLILFENGLVSLLS